VWLLKFIGLDPDTDILGSRKGPETRD
jgi:hypothetical protein